MITIRQFARGLRIALLAAVFLLFAWLLWHLAWVAYWGQVNPDMTRFMEIRLGEIREKTPDAKLQKQWIPYESISLDLKRAVIAAEDGKFVQHNGFDWEGIRTAMKKNEKRGKAVAGGSTITQQLAKNLFLSPERSLWRKGEEAVITLMIETLWSKRRIFEVYLNVIEWGRGVFGAEAAARYYFGIPAAKIGPVQAARLAAMVPSPRYFDRNRNSPRLDRQTEVILGRMHASALP